MSETTTIDPATEDVLTSSSAGWRRAGALLNNLAFVAVCMLAGIGAVTAGGRVYRYYTVPAQPKADISLLCTDDSDDYGIAVDLGDWRTGAVTMIALSAPSQSLAPAGAVTAVPGQPRVYLGTLPGDDDQVTVIIAQPGRPDRTLTRAGLAGLCAAGGQR